MNKAKKLFLAFILIIYIFSLPVFAEQIKRQEVYNAKSNNEKYEFESEIIENDLKYKLDNISYETIEKKDIVKKEAYERSFAYTDLYTNNNEQFEKQKTVTDEDTKEKIICQFEKAEYQDTVITNRSKEMTATVESEYELSEPTNFPAEKKITFVDEVTKKETVGTLSYINTEVLEEKKWVNDVEIQMIITDYESEKYQINETAYMTYNEEKPIILGVENDLLKSLGLSENEYHLTSADWQGEAYTENGTIKRNAVLYGERFVGKWVANYGGTVSLPDCAGFNATVYYIGEQTVPDGSEYTISATAIYSELPVEVKKTFPKTIIIGGASLLIIAVAGFVLIKFNNAIIYTMDGKRLFSTAIKRKVPCVINLSKAERYNVTQVKCKISKSYENKVNKYGIVFFSQGTVLKFSKQKNNLFIIDISK